MTNETIVLDLSNATPAEIDRAFVNIAAALTKGGPLNAETLLGDKPVTVAELAPLMRELGDVFAWRSPPDQTTAVALAAVKRATERNFWRRPLVMHFDGDFRDDDLKRRFEIVGLRAYATATGEVHVRETPVSSKRMHLEAMRAEILRLEREIADDEAQYVEDERATGDEK